METRQVHVEISRQRKWKVEELISRELKSSRAIQEQRAMYEDSTAYLLSRGHLRVIISFWEHLHHCFTSVCHRLLYEGTVSKLSGLGCQCSLHISGSMPNSWVVQHGGTHKWWYLDIPGNNLICGILPRADQPWAEGFES